MQVGLQAARQDMFGNEPWQVRKSCAFTCLICPILSYLPYSLLQPLRTRAFKAIVFGAQVNSMDK